MHGWVGGLPEMHVWGTEVVHSSSHHLGLWENLPMNKLGKGDDVDTHANMQNRTEMNIGIQTWAGVMWTH